MARMGRHLRVRFFRRYRAVLMEKNTVQLTSGEFLLLFSICDRKDGADHEIDYLSRELSRQHGTDAAPVSPPALDSLIRRELVRSSGMPGQGRGSPAGEFEITVAGKRLLQQEILAALAAARERDRRFDLALAASGMVPTPEVLVALAKRKSCLTEVAASLQARSGAQEQPLHLRALLGHPLSVVQCEIEFMELLIQALSSTSPSAACANERVSCTDSIA